VSEAVSLLETHTPGAELLAGGMSLIPRMKARRSRPRHVIDIGWLPELSGVSIQDGTMVIGALTKHAELASAPPVLRAAPLLAEAAARIGDPQVRNAGTIGGSVAEIYPGADLPACLLALRAKLRVVTSDGSRELSVGEQFASEDGVATGGRGLVTHIELPPVGERSGEAHVRLERKAGLAVVGCSARVVLDEHGAYTRVWAACNGLRPGPVLLIAGDGGLAGHRPDPELHRQVAEAALEDVESFDDVRGSAQYRRRTAAVVVTRTLNLAAQRGADR
jgi:carbon-monoxide dehydrogenase medium subunit